MLVLDEDILKPGHAERELRGRKPDVDHPDMGLAVAKDELAEVPIIT